MTALGTTEKGLTWTGGHLIKPYKIKTFMKQPKTKSGRSCHVFSFYFHCEIFIN